MLALACGAVVANGSSGADGASVAISAQLQIEEILLEEDLARHVELARIRSLALARLDEIYESLDAALQPTEPDAPGRIETLMSEIEFAESERSRLLVRERSLVDRIGQRRRRIELLDEQLGTLQGEPEDRGGRLSGDWEIVLMPSGQHGTMRLTQTGTVINGIYELEGGWDGSVQGTLIQRKVYLMRIDSQLGKSMELEGSLSADGDQIRGNWLRFELAGSAGGTGQWAAKRRRD